MVGGISFHQYELEAIDVVNAATSRNRYHGALIRIKFEGAFGYGSIHPWEELGDASLVETLDLLREGIKTPLAEQAIRCAEIDANARSNGVSLIEKTKIPLSHATAYLNKESISSAVASSFKTVKVKVGRDLNGELNAITDLHNTFPELRWRLDWNHTRSTNEVLHFLKQLGSSVCSMIDFMEDAWIPDEVVEQEIQEVPLAVDRSAANTKRTFPYYIIKPARDRVDVIIEKAMGAEAKVVFTSYMDHAIGQAYAAYCAGVAAEKYPEILSECGLITHGLFTNEPFFKELGDVSPEFHPPKGHGLGFGSRLENLPWKPLN